MQAVVEGKVNVHRARCIRPAVLVRGSWELLVLPTRRRSIERRQEREVIYRTTDRCLDPLGCSPVFYSGNWVAGAGPFYDTSSRPPPHEAAGAFRILTSAFGSADVSPSSHGLLNRGKLVLG